MPSEKPFGFGTYRVSQSVPEHVHALRVALQKGITIIDTSSNYMDGLSEKAIGETLASLTPAERQASFIITKAGYAQGQVLEMSKTLELNDRPYPEMVKLDDHIWYCISPRFLKDRLDESLRRLKKVDLFLLHNPEYFLKADPNHHEYYRRIEESFRYLESECQLGRISGYGVSSNTFTENKTHPEFTSLEILLDIAKKLAQESGTKHHFKAIQFPFNLFETDAWSLHQYPGGKNLIELAQSAGLKTFANRPLNSFTQNHLVRLANYPHHHGINLDQAVQKTLAQVLELETQLPSSLVSGQFWGHILKDQLKHLIDIEQWRQIETQRVKPALGALKKALILPSSTAFDVAGWWDQYEISMQALTLSISHWLENEASMRSERLRVKLVQAVPKLRPIKTLSGAALSIYRSIPGLNCVLVGMRKETYVEDVLGVLDQPPLTSEEAMDALDAASAFLDESSL